MRTETPEGNFKEHIRAERLIFTAIYLSIWPLIQPESATKGVWRWVKTTMICIVEMFDHACAS